MILILRKIIVACGGILGRKLFGLEAWIVLHAACFLLDGKLASTDDLIRVLCNHFVFRFQPVLWEFS